MSRSEWRIGVAGLGTVGGGLIQFLEARPDFAPAGARATVSGIAVALPAAGEPVPNDVTTALLEATARATGGACFYGLIGAPCCHMNRKSAYTMWRREFSRSGRGPFISIVAEAWAGLSSMRTVISSSPRTRRSETKRHIPYISSPSTPPHWHCSAAQAVTRILE